MNETLAVLQQESPLEKALQAGSRRRARVRNAFKRFGTRVGEVSGQATDFILGTPELIAEGTRRTTDFIGEKASGLKDTVVKKTSSFVGKVSEITSRTKEKVTHSCKKLASKTSEIKESAFNSIGKTKDRLSRWGLSHLVEPTRKRVAQICAIPERITTWATKKNVEPVPVKDLEKAQERAEKLVEAKELFQAAFAKIKENWQKGAGIEERLRAYKDAQRDYYSMFPSV